MKKILFFVLLSLGVFLLPCFCSSGVGVGVGIGKMKVEEDLKPGVIYELPLFIALNTGDEVGNYGVSVEYHRDQPEKMPPKDWFTFNPSTFSLEPGKAQQVEVILTLPLKAPPGDYFAFLEAHPIAEGKAGMTISVAAATKLWFTVVPASRIQALIYRLSYFFKKYSKFIWGVLIAIFVIAVILLFKRFFSFQVGVKKK